MMGWKGVLSMGEGPLALGRGWRAPWPPVTALRSSSLIENTPNVLGRGCACAYARPPPRPLSAIAGRPSVDGVSEPGKQLNMV